MRGARPLAIADVASVSEEFKVVNEFLQATIKPFSFVSCKAYTSPLEDCPITCFQLLPQKTKTITVPTNAIRESKT